MNNLLTLLTEKLSAFVSPLVRPAFSKLRKFRFSELTTGSFASASAVRTLTLAGLVLMYGTGSGLASSPAAKLPQTIVVSLPPASRGMSYLQRLQGPRNLAYPFHCEYDTQKVLPSLALDCATLTLHSQDGGPGSIFSSAVEKGTYSIDLKLTDSYETSQSYELTLQVVDFNEPPLVRLELSTTAVPAVSARPVAKPVIGVKLEAVKTEPAPLPGSLLDPGLMLATPLKEGTTKISGSVQNLPPSPADSKTPKSALSVAVCVFNPGVARGRAEQCNATGGFFASLKVADTDEGQKQTSVVDDKTGNFKFELAAGLLPGQRAAVVVLAPSGQQFTNGNVAAASPLVTIPSDLPQPSITITSVIQSGAQSITGIVHPLPDPAIPAPQSGTAGPPSNLPLVEVCLRDPLPAGSSSTPVSPCPNDVAGPNGATGPYLDAEPAGSPYLGLLKGSSTSTVTSVAVDADGKFIASLNTPLKDGQVVTVEVLPPQGRHFAGVTLAGVASEATTALSSLTLSQPVITSQLVEGVTTIKGTATTGSNGSVNVAFDVYGEGAGKTTLSPANPCPTLDRLGALRLGDDTSHRLFASLSSTDSTVEYVTVDAHGNFSATLANPLAAGQKISAIQILPGGTALPASANSLCISSEYVVPDTGNWGRIRAYFAGGILIANDSSGFSQAHQFYALNVDKDWLQPGCYVQTPSHDHDHDYGCYDSARKGPDDDPKVPDARVTYPGWWSRHHPGFSTYFETRLTAIPVASVNNATSGSSTGTGTSTGTIHNVPIPAATTTDTSSNSANTNFLTTQKTVRVGTGAYFPFLVTRWTWQDRPNALFFAPIAKVGFDTITAPTTQQVVVPDHTTGSQTYEPIYNFYSFGGRIGHMELTDTEARAPEVFSYLDVTFGPYSNLESYICHATPTLPASGADATFTGSSCRTTYPKLYGTAPTLATAGTPAAPGTPPYAVDSLKRIWRLDLEGLLKIPASPIYVGFNANIGQKVFGAGNADPAFKAPDDLRFFFGTKFDLGTALKKLGVPAP